MNKNSYIKIAKKTAKTQIKELGKINKIFNNSFVKAIDAILNWWTSSGRIEEKEVLVKCIRNAFQNKWHKIACCVFRQRLFGSIDIWTKMIVCRSTR